MVHVSLTVIGHRWRVQTTCTVTESERPPAAAETVAIPNATAVAVPPLSTRSTAGLLDLHAAGPTGYDCPDRSKPMSCRCVVSFTMNDFNATKERISTLTSDAEPVPESLQASAHSTRQAQPSSRRRPMVSIRYEWPGGA